MKAETFHCDLCKNEIERFGLGHHGIGVAYNKDGRQPRVVTCSDPSATAHICSACFGQICEHKRRSDESDLY